MLRNYFKIAWRSFTKNRVVSFINLFGLIAGFACGILIFLWIQYQYSYNNQFNDKDHIYLVCNNFNFDGEITTYQTTSAPLAPALKSEVPEIDYATRMVNFSNSLISKDLKKKYTSGVYADSNFFKIFNFKILSGTISNSSFQKESIILTKTLAGQLFGKENPIGKVVKTDAYNVANVIAVIEDVPANTSFQFDWIRNFSFIYTADMNVWNANSFKTYIKLNKNADAEKLATTIKSFVQKKDPSIKNASLYLFALKDWHLNNQFTDGRPSGKGVVRYVKIFGIIAISILLIACINFINLSTALGMNRTKEIGLRKVLGATKKSIKWQYMTETFFQVSASFLLSLFLAFLLLPYFGGLATEHISFGVLSFYQWLALIFIVVFTGVLAGSYPSFRLSSLSPVATLKSTKTEGKGRLQKALIIAQFTVSLFLIVAATVIYQQIQFTKNRDIGFQKDRVVYFESAGILMNGFDVVKNKLMATGYVQSVGSGMASPIGVYNSSGSIKWNGVKDNEKHLISNQLISSGYLPTLNIPMVAGRDFYTNAADTNNVIINESFAKLMGKEGHVGGKILFGNNTKNIIGICKNFIFDDLNLLTAKPVLYFTNDYNYGSVFVKVKDKADMQQALQKITNILKELNPDFPVVYHFLDKDYARYFKSQELLARLSTIFGIIAVIISCLGLYGLSTFIIIQKQKEIAVRKVLGASVFSVVNMLNKRFLLLVVIACAVAFPLAWLVMKRWLHNYEYRINIDYAVFAFAAAIVFFIALLTVSFQTVRAAKANPVKSLKTE